MSERPGKTLFCGVASGVLGVRIDWHEGDIGICRVADAADVTVDYALINGKRSVYIPVVKTADASTWSVVQNLKSKIPEMQSLLPDDVKISYEFDQSVFVINAVKSQ